MADKEMAAIFYDYIKVPGGAERVALELAEHFSAELCVGYNNPTVVETLGFSKQINIRTLSYQFQNLLLETFFLFQCFLRTNPGLNHYDWAVYSGTFAPLAALRVNSKKKIMYSHALPRFVYDMKQYRKHDESLVYRVLKRSFASILQRKYEAAVDVMDVLIANSCNVQKRIELYLERESTVIHPPCDIENYKWSADDNYYLSLARLEPYKRVDILIKAFLKMPDKKLVVASGGSDYCRLKKLANNADNIYFTNWIDKCALSRLISKSIATLYIPIDEDFGMSPVESMAAGKPVLGVKEGGLLETIVHNETGFLLNANPSVDMVINAIKELTSKRAEQMRKCCQQRAQLFSKHSFMEKIHEVILGQ